MAIAGDVTGRRVLRVLAVTLLFGTAGLASPAQAQFFGWSGWDNGGAWGGLPGPQVRRSITDQGFRVLGPLRRNGNVFVADVIDPRGRHERLIVASSDAQILQRFYVDDGRGSGPGPFARGDDEGGLVPPADIPGAPRARIERTRRFAEPPAEQDAPARRFGAPDTEGPDTAVVEPPPLRSQPPVKTVRPAPRVVERTPETPQRREPGGVDSMPLAPVAPKPRTVEPPAHAGAPMAPAPATVASRPDAAPAAPAPAAVPSPQPRRLTDPLAIPGGTARSADPAPPRSVSGSITGAPAPVVKPGEGATKPSEVPASKTGDVPAAPLD